MCILCETQALELLTEPIESLPPGELAEAIRTAREAAGPGLMDHAEAVLRGEARPDLDAGLYGEIVVTRAQEAGVLRPSRARSWRAALENGAALRDPRVQAFVSAGAEMVDEYRRLLYERQPVVARFVEAAPNSVRVTGLGRDGELWFSCRGEHYTVLTEDEALDVVEREITAQLHSLEPEVLLGYASLPEGALEVLREVQRKPVDVANAILAGLVDVPALAQARTRTEGYARFFATEEDEHLEEMRFGGWIVLRVPETT
jgi:hypothetical protein